MQKAVDFARTRNIRLNIKSTGHDFLGRYIQRFFDFVSYIPLTKTRSVQPKSLSIWTHYLRDLKYHDGYKPQGCNITIPGPAVSAGSGSQMREVCFALFASMVMSAKSSSCTDLLQTAT